MVLGRPIDRRRSRILRLSEDLLWFDGACLSLPRSFLSDLWFNPLNHAGLYLFSGSPLPQDRCVSCILVTGVVGDMLSAAWGRSQLGDSCFILWPSADGTHPSRDLRGSLGARCPRRCLHSTHFSTCDSYGGRRDIGPRLAELFVPSLTMMALSAPLLTLFTLIEGLVSLG